MQSAIVVVFSVKSVLPLLLLLGVRNIVVAINVVVVRF